MTDRERFEKIRQRFLAAKERQRTQEDYYRRRYGRHDPPYSWRTRSELRRDEAIQAAFNRESDRLFKVLDSVGGRNWHVGVPWWWVMAELTYEDAVTTDSLSVIPPVPYGSTPRDVERFAQAVA